jgi:hypothetical protein
MNKCIRRQEHNLTGILQLIDYTGSVSKATPSATIKAKPQPGASSLNYDDTLIQAPSVVRHCRPHPLFNQNSPSSRANPLSVFSTLTTSTPLQITASHIATSLSSVCYLHSNCLISEKPASFLQLLTSFRIINHGFRTPPINSRPPRRSARPLNSPRRHGYHQLRPYQGHSPRPSL